MRKCQHLTHTDIHSSLPLPHLLTVLQDYLAYVHIRLQSICFSPDSSEPELPSTRISNHPFKETSLTLFPRKPTPSPASFPPLKRFLHLSPSSCLGHLSLLTRTLRVSLVSPPSNLCSMSWSRFSFLKWRCEHFTLT